MVTQYPVPHPSKNPVSAFIDSSEGEGTMWEGEYGQARIRFCEFVVTEFKEMLKNI